MQNQPRIPEAKLGARASGTQLPPAWPPYILCVYIYRIQQKLGLLECGWKDNNMGVIIYSFNSNISPKMSYCVLECDIVMLQNYMVMILQ